MSLTQWQKSEFDQWYSSYPHKVTKGQARRAWAKINPDSLLISRMRMAIESQKAERVWKLDRGIFVPEWKHPATWLNGECWEDEVQTEPPLGGVHSRKAGVKREAIQRSVDKVLKEKHGKPRNDETDPILDESDLPF